MVLPAFSKHIQLMNLSLWSGGGNGKVVFISVTVTINNHLIVQCVLWLVPIVFWLLWGWMNLLNKTPGIPGPFALQGLFSGYRVIFRERTSHHNYRFIINFFFYHPWAEYWLRFLFPLAVVVYISKPLWEFFSEYQRNMVKWKSVWFDVWVGDSIHHKIHSSCENGFA